MARTRHGAQIIGVAFPGGELGYGLQPYGTSPYGGSAHPVEEWPRVVLPGDHPSDQLAERVHERVLDRDGEPIAIVTRGQVGTFTLRFHLLTTQQVQLLRTYWRARVFTYFPNLDEPSISLRTRWVESEFRPQPFNRGARYDLGASLEVMGTYASV
jgi:hypothetical protein